MNPTALERIEALEKKVQELEANTANTATFAERAIQNVSALGQSQSAFGKTLTALISILTEKGTVDSDAILTKIREIDDRSERERVEHMVRNGVLVSSEVSNAESIVVVKQIFVPSANPEKPVELSNFRAVELFSPEMPPQLRDQLVDKKVGDTITTKSKEGDFLNTFVAIYNIAPEKAGGEGEANGEVKTG